MRKNLTFISISLFLAFLIVAGVAVFGAYQLGAKQQNVRLGELQDKLDKKNVGYETNIQTIRDERDMALNKYQSSCIEFIQLRTSYDQLYIKYGTASGIKKYVVPDNARGDEISCYR